MKVLMATDGSKYATIALQTACRLLKRDSVRARVVCVAPGFHMPEGRRRLKKGEGVRIREQYRSQIAAETKRILDEAQAALRADGIDADLLPEIGSPADVIVRLAAVNDVTVIGTHGPRERTQPGLGYVAGRVVEHAPGAVLVGRELVGERSFRILVAVDGSLASAHAVRTLATFFNAATAEITLMHVVEQPWLRLGLEQEWFDYPGYVTDQADPQLLLRRELRAEAEGVIEESRSLLEEYGLSATTIIAEGDPALELLGETDSGDYDLVTLGATGLADLKHTLLGSVSARIARDAPCSVLVVKHAP